MADWLFSYISRVYHHIMEVIGRNNRTPVEHSEEGMIWRFSHRNIVSLALFYGRISTHYVVAKSAQDVYYFKLSYSVLVSYTYCI